MSPTERRNLLMFKRDLRRELWAWSRKCMIPFRVLMQLDEMYRQDQGTLAIVLCLLKTKTFKSSFRQSLATQVRRWCLDEEHRTHIYPLTSRQVACCKDKGEQHHLNELPRHVAQVNHQRRVNPCSH